MLGWEGVGGWRTVIQRAWWEYRSKETEEQKRSSEKKLPSEGGKCVEWEKKECDKKPLRERKDGRHRGVLAAQGNGLRWFEVFRGESEEFFHGAKGTQIRITPLWGP